MEMAAKAAEIKLDGIASKQIAQGARQCDFLCLNEQGGHSIWNPLADDGDALRLAVALRFGLKDFAPTDYEDPPNDSAFGMIEVWRQDADNPLHIEWYKAGADRYAATRSAIVSAAAELGKLMP